MVWIDDIRTERVNEEILLGRKCIPCSKFISSCTIMYVQLCSYDLHYNVLWDRYATELKEISIPPREKAYFHAKLPSPLLLWFNQPLHCNDVGMAYIII